LYNIHEKVLNRWSKAGLKNNPGITIQPLVIDREKELFEQSAKYLISPRNENYSPYFKMVFTKDTILASDFLGEGEENVSQFNLIDDSKSTKVRNVYFIDHQENKSTSFDFKEEIEGLRTSLTNQNLAMNNRLNEMEKRLNGLSSK
jgi:hypothetical protein